LEEHGAPVSTFAAPVKTIVGNLDVAMLPWPGVEHEIGRFHPYIHGDAC
jgi:hypothetical protein